MVQEWAPGLSLANEILTLELQNPHDNGEVPGQGKVMQTGAKLAPAKEEGGGGRTVKRRRNWSTPGQGPVAHKVNGEAVPIVSMQVLKNCRFLYYRYSLCHLGLQGLHTGCLPRGLLFSPFIEATNFRSQLNHHILEISGTTLLEVSFPIGCISREG